VRRFWRISSCRCEMEQEREIETEPPARIIVGLGNPGRRYARSRHNIGFMVLESIARKANGRWLETPLFRTCRIDLGSHPVLLVEPLTYMNRSGEAVHALLSNLQRKPQDLLLVVDDLNLPFGRIRVRSGFCFVGFSAAETDGTGRPDPQSRKCRSVDIERRRFQNNGDF